jgi:hypothetical protein
MSGRARQRDAFTWDFNTGEQLGGLAVAPGVTNRDFRQMIDILVVTSETLVVQYKDGGELESDDQPLRPGHYLLAADDLKVSKSVDTIILPCCSQAFFFFCVTYTHPFQLSTR